MRHRSNARYLPTIARSDTAEKHNGRGSYFLATHRGGTSRIVEAITEPDLIQTVAAAIIASGHLAPHRAPRGCHAKWSARNDPTTECPAPRPSGAHRGPPRRPADGVHSSFTGGSFVGRHPCSDTVDGVYELGLIGLVYPLGDANSRQGFVQGAFGMGAVF